MCAYQALSPLEDARCDQIESAIWGDETQSEQSWKDTTSLPFAHSKLKPFALWHQSIRLPFRGHT